MPNDRLRLLAVDRDDLDIVSAHCQDAIVRLGDCHFRAKELQFAVEMNRFAWESAATRRLSVFSAPRYERRRSALHFDRVTNVRRQGLDHSNDDQILVLLAIRFEETEAPSGRIDLIFAGGATIRLEVEVIEAQLADAGGAWSTDSRPDHKRSAS
ncbi:DUF2948 family protein [Fulvimarina sp. 2208YS6-2-32]|uniref:DUF2948 family protein n=1 Tax=Fulvimarina uroteuthidis TaxID=3098149 RepID=A0ABU5I5P1_9HYPH|nr:DUF2948 family protein [Fulvimarina sp. 2208YS6-2-32]MDY8110716.1 DUF2948 family protein [Fulvimarina sp. 2208YS6-2-32]